MAAAAQPSVAGQRVELDGGRVYQVVFTQGGWLVSSASQGGFWRVQPAQDGRLMCACPGWIWRGQCRHLKAVERTQTASLAAAS